MGLFPAPDRVRVHEFPDADHRLEIDMGPDREGVWRWPRVAPGVEPAVKSWLREHGLN